jgi:hypothetical protein
MRYNLRPSASVPETAVVVSFEYPTRITVAEAEQFVADVRANLSNPKPARYRLRYKRPGQEERNLIVAGVTVDRDNGLLRYEHPAVFASSGSRCGIGSGFLPSALIEFAPVE